MRLLPRRLERPSTVTAPFKFALRPLAFALVLAASPLIHAELTAYYTLDDTGAGIQNMGSDGATSDLSAANVAATPTVALGGIVGNALSFDGNDLLRNLGQGNAGDDLLSYPFTLSIWMRNVPLTTTRKAAFAISDIAVGDRYYNVGAETVSGRAEPELVRRNTAFTALDASGGNVSGSGWTNVVALFDTTTASIYLNGKLVNSAPISQAFNPSVNTLSIGGFLRNNGTTATDPYTGQLDEAGLFNTALTAADVALINGLGLTGAIGLDQLDEAQALNAQLTGTTAEFGGAEWRKVSGLAGTTGDYGGSVSGGNAFIVTDTEGNGLQVIPEPGATGLVAVGLLGLVLRQRRRTQLYPARTRSEA